MRFQYQPIHVLCAFDLAFDGCDRFPTFGISPPFSFGLTFICLFRLSSVLHPKSFLCFRQLSNRFVKALNLFLVIRTMS